MKLYLIAVAIVVTISQVRAEQGDCRSKGQWYCYMGEPYCHTNQQRCDGNRDCLDGSDESDCGGEDDRRTLATPAMDRVCGREDVKGMEWLGLPEEPSLYFSCDDVAYAYRCPTNSKFNYDKQGCIDEKTGRLWKVNYKIFC